MATWNVTATIKAEDYAWGRIYSGPRADLIAQGLADAARFPGEPGNRRHTVRYREADGRSITIQRGRRDGEFRVHRDHTPEERQQAERRELEARAIEEARREIAKLPVSAAAFRAKLKRTVATACAWAREDAMRGIGGYTIAPDDLHEIEQAMVDLCAAIEGARVLFDQRARREQEQKITTGALGTSADFERFMAGVLADAPRRDEEAR